MPGPFQMFAAKLLDMEKNRLEAFSDGVLAIIITIMVLELEVPRSPELSALAALWPVFTAYALSFAFVGIYWVNHHHLVHTVHRTNAGIMWHNLFLLFFLSLVPFATAWMGENHFATVPVAVYAVLMLACGVAYQMLARCITGSQPHDERVQHALKSGEKKGLASLIGYAAAIPLAFVDVRISLFIFVAVAVVWFVPSRSLERAFRAM